MKYENIIRTHVAYLRKLEQQIAVAADGERRELETKIRSARGRLQVIFNNTKS